MCDNKWIFSLVFGGLIEVCLVGMWWLGDMSHHIPTFFCLYGVASLVYVAAIFKRTEIALSHIWVFAVIFRVTLLFTTPSLSDDIFRYVWDGRVLASGINPYLYAPQSEVLAHLRDDVIHPFINHPELPTIYPPVAQGLFLVGKVLFDSVWGVKILIVGADLMVGWLLLKLLRMYQKDRLGVMVYLWHPLVIVEGAGSGHIDFLGVLAVVAALWAWETRRDLWAFAFVGGAILTKFLPVILVPSFVRWSKRWFPTNWRAFLVLPLCLVVGYLPFVFMEGPLWGSLHKYVAHWEFNSPVFWMMRHVLGDGDLTRQVIGCVILCVLVWVTYLRCSPPKACFIMLTTFVLLTPTLHPWYLVWLIPFLVFQPHVGWLGFSLMVALSYEVLIGFRLEGVWEESAWVWAIEFGTLMVMSILLYIYPQRFGNCMS